MKQGVGSRVEGAQLDGDDQSTSNRQQTGREMGMFAMFLFSVGEQGATPGGTATSWGSRDRNMKSWPCSELTRAGTFSVQNCKDPSLVLSGTCHVI